MTTGKHRARAILLLAGLFAGCASLDHGHASSAQVVPNAEQVQPNHLFVGSEHYIFVYDVRTGKLLDTITVPGDNSAQQMIRDSSGNLYIRGFRVWIKPSGSDKISPTSYPGIFYASGIALDSKGNLYVADEPPGRYGSVVEFAAGTMTIVRTITRGINVPMALAIDGKDNLYVASWRIHRTGAVTVYSPGETSVQRTITQDLLLPNALAIDSSNNLYVTSNNSVVVFAPGGAKLLRVLPLSGGASALAFDRFENLYAMGSNVTVFPPGSTTPLRAITTVDPASMALDGANNLYVGSWNIGTVTEYKAETTTLLRTISLRQNYNPYSLIFAPEAR